MKKSVNIWLVILAVIVSGGMGYWLGVQPDFFKKNSEGFLKRTDFFLPPDTLGRIRIRDTTILQTTARKYTERYRDFIAKKVLLTKTDSVRIRDFIHPPKSGISAEFPYYRIQRSSIDSIFKQKNVVTLCIFPAINSKNEFTFVLVGEDKSYDLVLGKIYDEVEVCPPPKPCKSF